MPFFSRSGFFNPKSAEYGSDENKFGNMRIIFTVGGNTVECSNVLADECVEDQLITYYYARHDKVLDIADYVRRGRIFGYEESHFDGA